MTTQEKFNRISIINVKNKLNLKEVCSKGKIIYVKCPFCNSINADLKLNTQNNTYICKNCEESGSSISLYAKNHFSMSNKEAFKKLMSMESNMQTNLNSYYNNYKKNSDELDEVYTEFLGLLTLSKKHREKLQQLGFKNEDIKTIGFKTIPINEYEKIEICNNLIKSGYSLQGVPGFFQNDKFKWTFKSHNGFFVPVKNNMKIEALRIHLDSLYKTNTTDIWFSSSNEYNGSMINNNIMIIKPEYFKLRTVSGNNKKVNIIVATEMLLAYKLHTMYEDTIVIGIPNYLSKNEIRKFYKIVNINKIILVYDYHAALHNSSAIIENLKQIYPNKNINISFSIKNYKIENILSEKLESETNLKEIEKLIA